jgi:hypothetical protein
MNEREKLLRRVALKCADCIRQLSFHRALEGNRSFKQNFWIYMYNNAIDLAVLDWFHLFGYHNDDLHWKQIVEDVDLFRQGLMQSVGMTIDEWQKYRETIKDYRDKDVAHIEVRPLSQVPDMAVAIQATTYYYSIVLAELSEFRDYSAWPNQLDEYYKKSLEQSKAIASVACSASSGIQEAVF